MDDSNPLAVTASRDTQALCHPADVTSRWRENPTYAAQRLQLLREAAGFSREELCVRTGINAVQLSNIEDGLWSPLAPTVRKLGLSLGVSPEWFVDDSPIGM